MNKTRSRGYNLIILIVLKKEYINDISRSKRLKIVSLKKKLKSHYK